MACLRVLITKLAVQKVVWYTLQCYYINKLPLFFLVCKMHTSCWLGPGLIPGLMLSKELEVGRRQHIVNLQWQRAPNSY